MMNRFLTENSSTMRMLRTIFQGVIGVIIANIDLLASFMTINPALKPVIVALVMAILAPVMSELGKGEGGGHD